jgi:hypothetical protein
VYAEIDKKVRAVSKEMKDVPLQVGGEDEETETGPSEE